MHLRYHFAVLLFMALLQCQPKLCFGQIPVMDGLAVTNDHDTIRGKIEYVSRSLFENKLVFVSDPSVKISVFRPFEIRGLYSDSGISYESKELDGETIFLRALSKGRVNLYSDGKDMFLSNGPFKVIQLKGGSETVVIDGKAYAQKLNSYKGQLISQVVESSFHAKIAALPFKQKAVLNLIKEVNNDLIAAPKLRLYNRGYLSFEAGYSLNVLHKNLEPDDDLADFVNHPRRHRTTSLVAGVRYKRKILKTRSHLGFGLHFEHTPRVIVEETKLLHSAMTYPGAGGPPYPSDTTGSEVKVYSYDLSSMNFSIGIIPEVSNGRFRPFFDIGIVSKLCLTSDAAFTRTVYDENGAVTEKTDRKIQVNSLIFGPRLGSGCRLIIDMNRSLSAGFNAELFLMSKLHIDATKIFVKQFYLSYGF